MTCITIHQLNSQHNEPSPDPSDGIHSAETDATATAGDGGRGLSIAIIGSGLASLSTAICLVKGIILETSNAPSPSSTSTGATSTPTSVAASIVTSPFTGSLIGGGCDGDQACRNHDGETHDTDKRHRKKKRNKNHQLRTTRNKTKSSSTVKTITSITIYERDGSFGSRKDGYGLTLKYDVNSVLGPKHLDVLEEICLKDCPSRSHYVLNHDGTIWGYYGNAFTTTTTPTPTPNNYDSNNYNNKYRRHRRSGGGGLGQRGNLRVPRQDVRRILLSKLMSLSKSLTSCTVQVKWGHKLVSLYPVSSLDNSKANALPQMQCEFDNGVVAVADWVVGADGIRSNVVSSIFPTAPAPQPMGIRLIVGISSFASAEDNVYDPAFLSLLDERGFYTYSPNHRLFVMPYTAPTPLYPHQVHRYMWQLSFLEPIRDCGLLENATSQQLLQLALTKCKNWHRPAPELLHNTTLDMIWSSHLYDRDPQSLYKQWLQQQQQQHILPIFVIGDAMHAMSCFKGQGAHQALYDGSCIGKWLLQYSQGHCSATATLKNGWREIVQRTTPIVLDSRIAAHALHGIATKDHHKPSDGATAAVFAGVHDPKQVSTLLQKLRECNIRAGITKHLDHTIGRILRCELGTMDVTTTILNGVPNNYTMAEDEDDDDDYDGPSEAWKMGVYNAIQRGDLSQLRQLSWVSNDSTWMRNLVFDDSENNTCLHLAVQCADQNDDGATIMQQHQHKHDDTCSNTTLTSVASTTTSYRPRGACALEMVQWLVVEAGLSCQATNRLGNQRPIQLVQRNMELQALLQGLQEYEAIRRNRHKV